MIGVFDSGVGGLSVLNEIRKRLPHHALIYFADTANVPYGDKSEAFIRDRSLIISEFLESEGAELIVIACNTATSAAAEAVRAEVSVQVVAIEPPVKPAVVASKTKIIGVLATEVTLRSPRYQSLLSRFGSGAKIISRVSNDLVPLIEAGLWETESGRAIVRDIVSHFLDHGADTLVLGSTHFSFLKGLVLELSDGKLQPIGPAEATAQQVQRVLQGRDVDESSQTHAPIELWVSGDLKEFEKNFATFSPYKVEFYQAEF